MYNAIFFYYTYFTVVLCNSLLIGVFGILQRKVNVADCIADVIINTHCHVAAVELLQRFDFSFS